MSLARPGAKAPPALAAPPPRAGATAGRTMVPPPASGAPHWAQNRASAGQADLHTEQITARPESPSVAEATPLGGGAATVTSSSSSPSSAAAAGVGGAGTLAAAKKPVNPAGARASSQLWHTPTPGGL